MIDKNDIRVVAFDADDTLWDNETHFKQVEHDMCKVLEQYAPAETVSEHLFATEMKNMPDYGYGAIAFTLSLMENAIKVTNGKVTGEELLQILELGRSLLHLKATPLPGVTDVLSYLSGKYHLVLFTKGELLTQEHKLQRSGLKPFFEKTVIVSDKQETQYRELYHDLGIQPKQFVMVGNSLKSDIRPALDTGACAIYIPFDVMWQHEVTDDFEHPHMVRIENFEEIKRYL